MMTEALQALAQREAAQQLQQSHTRMRKAAWAQTQDKIAQAEVCINSEPIRVREGVYVCTK